MNLQEILNDIDFWLQKDLIYHIDNDWQLKIENPSTYKAFKWRKIYSFRTPMLLLYIKLREHVDGFYNENINKTQYKRCNYSVAITGGKTGIPLPLEHWGNEKDFLKGFNMFIDLFYIGEKYKSNWTSKFYEDQDKHAGTPSGLICGFNNLLDAKEFIGKWKNKLINDHEKEIKIQKKLLDIIKDDGNNE